MFQSTWTCIKWILNEYQKGFLCHRFFLSLLLLLLRLLVRLDLLLLKLNSNLCVYNSVWFPFGPFYVTHFSLLFIVIRHSLGRVCVVCAFRFLFVASNRWLPSRTNLFHYMYTIFDVFPVFRFTMDGKEKSQFGKHLIEKRYRFIALSCLFLWMKTPKRRTRTNKEENGLI